MRNIWSGFACVLLMCLFCLPALATNGMMIEGYGPISHALGGAATAYDNGNGAMANNPATLGMMPEGNRVDVAIGLLRPDVNFYSNGRRYESDATSFILPAGGFIQRKGDFAYGLGVYSQGGMGTDYMSDLNMYSQVVVGKVIVPLAYNVTDKLTVAGTAEYIWAGMDMVMGPFHFKDNSDFSGAATGEGYSGKLGAVYKLHDRFHIGASYQFRAGIGDLTGKGARVQGFDMPAVLSLGFAAHLNDKTMFTMDYKRVFWSDTMKTITVTQNGMTAGIPQYWEDQNVLGMGLAYKALPELTLRVGANFAENPIKENCTPLFPAFVKNHYTAGFGYEFNEQHSIDASFAYAPKVEMANGLQFAGTRTTHSQTSMQFMYSYKF